MTTVMMEGFEELRARLAEMANAEAIKKEALEKAGEHLSQSIANAVPVRTGALKASIIKSEVKNDTILIGPSQQGPAYRAHFLEYGTSKMTAKPFMRPTFESEKSRIEQILKEEVRRGLGL